MLASSSASTSCSRCCGPRSSDRCPSPTCSRSPCCWPLVAFDHAVPGPVHRDRARGRAASARAGPRPGRARRSTALAGTDPAREQGWRAYAGSLLVFSLLSILVLYLQQRLQAVLPLNPTGAPAVPPDLALNTAVSFTTNTNWQNYAGETTMAHLTQAAGLAVQNFLSAAVGLAIAIALVRGHHPADVADDRQLLGGRHAVHALRPAADRVRRRDRPRLAGRPPDLVRPRLGHGARGPRAVDLPRPDRVPGGDQGAGHQRRRHRQRELRAPVREPHAAHQPPRAAPHPGHPVLAHRDVRGHGRRPAPGLGDLRAPWPPSSPSPRPPAILAEHAANPLFPAGIDQALGQHGGQGGPVRRLGRRPVGRDHDRRPARAP